MKSSNTRACQTEVTSIVKDTTDRGGRHRLSIGGYNLGQNEWNISTSPPPHFNDAKMAGFGLRAPSSLLWGGRGLIVPFYSVQDCLRFTLA